MKNFVGIDLGTTNSAICSYDGSETRIWKSPEQNDVTSSAIYIDRRGNKYVGKRAYDSAPHSPDNAATLFKRLMGTSTPVQFSAVNLTKTPEECSAGRIPRNLSISLGDYEKNSFRRRDWRIYMLNKNFTNAIAVSLSIIQILFILFIGNASASITVAEARDYARGTWELASASNDILDIALGKSYDGIPFLDWIDLLVSFDSVHDHLENQKFYGALDVGAIFLKGFVYSEKIRYLELPGIALTASLAFAPIKYSLVNFANTSVKTTIDYQTKLYFLARDAGCSHESIIKRTCEKVDLFTHDGWILSVGGRRKTGYASITPSTNTPDQIYNVARLSWETSNQKALYIKDKAAIQNSFLETVLEQTKSHAKLRAFQKATVYGGIIKKAYTIGNTYYSVGYPTGVKIAELNSGDVVGLIDMYFNDTESKFTLKVKMKNGLIGYALRTSFEIIETLDERGAFLELLNSTTYEIEGDFETANSEMNKLEKYLEKYPNGSYSNDVGRYTIGLCIYIQKNIFHADERCLRMPAKIARNIIDRYPYSQWIEDAKKVNFAVESNPESLKDLKLSNNNFYEKILDDEQ